jgi:arylsulfatase A-like enzyme
MLLSLAAVLVPVALGLGFLAFSQKARTLSNPKNVVIIGIDTLRTDHTSFKPPGPGERDLTPHLRRLAEKGTVFSSAVSQSSWTMPAFASILTGRYPREHGAYRFNSFLRLEELTLAEILREHGFGTGAVVSHVLVNWNHGFGQGVDDFDEENALGEWAITSAGVTDRALDFLREASDQRFFLFAHYFDPHYEFRNHDDLPWADQYSGLLADKDYTIQFLRSQRHRLEPTDVEHLTDLYDEEIAYTDRQVGRLMEHLEQSGLAEETLVIVVGDHGEEFMERGWIGHTISLYDEVVKVPMIVVVPGERTAPAVSDVVETRAVFYTVMDVLGMLPERSDAFPSLLPLMRGEGRATGAFSEVWIDASEISGGKEIHLSSHQSGRWKVIHDHDRDTTLLFDLANDPGEREDLSIEHPEILQEIKAELDRWLESMDQPGTDPGRQTLDPETIRRLKALGYL